MGSIKIYLKIFIYSLIYFFKKSLDNALKLSIYKKNSLDKKINFNLFGFNFYSPLSSQTLSAIKKIENNSNEIIKIYKFLDNPSNIFDIGANIGYWSFSFYKLNSNYIDKVYCFEPNNLSFKYLKLNLGHLENFELYNFGISFEDKETKISLPYWEKDRPYNLGLYSVLAKSNINSQKIFLKKFDNLFNVVKNKNYLFKIDVEGMENEVIMGSYSFLSSKNKISIIIELNNKIDQFTDNNIEKSLKLLFKLNYQSYMIENGDIKKIDYDTMKFNIFNNLNYDFIFKNF